MQRKIAEAMAGVLAAGRRQSLASTADDSKGGNAERDETGDNPEHSTAGGRPGNGAGDDPRGGVVWDGQGVVAPEERECVICMENFTKVLYCVCAVVSQHSSRPVLVVSSFQQSRAGTC